MDIAEFLLARIAEDQNRSLRDLIRPPTGRPNDGLTLDYLGYVNRALDECDAKRQIVEFYGGPVGRMYVLQFLALPYAGHPDYDPEWKP